MVNGIIRISSNIGLYVSSVAVLIIMLLVTVEVVARNLFNFSTLIADEISGYLLGSLTFLGLALTFRQGGFLRIDTYRAKSKGYIRRVIDLSSYCAAAAYVGLLDWYFWQFAWNSYHFGTRAISFLRTPLWIPHTTMAIGMLILFLEILTEGGRVVFRLCEKQNDPHID